MADKKQYGFTLVEIIVSLLVASVILSFAGVFIFIGERIFADFTDKNHAKIIGDSSLEFVTKTLRYSNNVKIAYSGEPIAEYQNALWISPQGQLFYENNNQSGFSVFGNEFYSGKQLSLEISMLSDHCILIGIYVLKNGESLYFSHTAVSLINISLGDGIVDFKFPEETTADNPTVLFNMYSAENE
ncbi:MAG: prepilin-type N-terminal cleavage/methylation domain-containing protein [Oscillospiraceae bacterium]|jgi:prepilin-type N-terminal cleavage/methylation domain-containing protein